jgi:hypothetical protein
LINSNAAARAAASRNLDLSAPGLHPSPHSIDTITMAGSKVGPRKSDGSGSCYLFRLDDEWIVDATHKGSAARFMNHCCEPNAYSEVLLVDGEKRILILALRDLRRGEEITYNYRCVAGTAGGAGAWVACGGVRGKPWTLVS